VFSGSPGCAAADGASSLLCPSTFSAGLVAPLWPRPPARPVLGPWPRPGRRAVRLPACIGPRHCTA